MGEGLSGGGVPGRRRGPGGVLSGSADTGDGAALETFLSAALRTDTLDPQAEQRAVTAFRAARDTGAHRAHARRRDDWRAPGRRRPRRSLRMTFGAVFASLTLGGVAVAAIGSVASSHRGGDDRGTTHPSATAAHRPGAAASAAPSDGTRRTGGPAAARDTEAHCRAYEQVHGRGKALDAKVWQQLVAAAGGRSEVAAYCSERLARATATPSGSAGDRGSEAGNAGTGTGTAGGTGASGTGTSGRTGTSGNGTGTGTGGTDNSAGKGRTGGGKHR